MADVVINKETGDAEVLDRGQAIASLTKGTHDLPMNDPEGNPVIVPYNEAQQWLAKGYTQPTSAQLGSLVKNTQFGTGKEQLKTALEGAAENATFGLSTGLEKALGVPEENIQARREINPGSHTAGQIAGLAASTLIPGVGEANVLEKAGLGASKLLGLGAEGAGLASRLGSQAVRSGVEMALMQAGDENSKLLSNDPATSGESAAINIGLSGLMGLGGGAAMGAISPLAKAVMPVKIAEEIENLKSRLKFKIENPEPLEAVTHEAQKLYDNVQSMTRATYGENGIRSKELQNLMPESMEKPISQTRDIIRQARDAISELGDDPMARLLKNPVDRLSSKLFPEGLIKPTEAPKSWEIFDAVNRFKQEVQELADFQSPFPSLSERDVVKAARNLSQPVRTALEDTEVWGEAGKFQKELNSIISEHIPVAKEMTKRFTESQYGERQISPGKIQTYLNQLGKPQAEFKQETMQDFLDSSDKLRKQLEPIFVKHGVTNPFEPSSTDMLRSTLGSPTLGGKVADFLTNKYLSSHAIAGVIGAGVGHIVGHPEAGAIVGERALGPAIEKILPAIITPFLTKSGSAEGLRAATQLGEASISGFGHMQNAAKALFKSGSEVLPTKLLPKDKDIEKIKAHMNDDEEAMNKVMDAHQHASYYMENHTSAMAASAMRGAQALNQLRPSTAKLGLLDPNKVPSKSEEAKYDRAIRFLEQPLLVAQHIKEGTITSSDTKLVSNAYPNLYNKMKEEFGKEMVAHITKGETIPYKTRIGLSLFMGQNLDSTMTPQAIMAAQPKPNQPQPTSGQPKQKGSMKNLSQFASMQETPIQQRLQRRGA